MARPALEALLREHRLDRTLTTALPPLDPHDEHAVAPTGCARLDAQLGGGFPRGQLSELIGSRSAGCTTLLLQTLAAATARGELVAVIDALDMFDVASAVAAQIDLDRVLWVRGHVTAHPGLCGDTNQRALEQAVRALALVLQAGGFGVVAFDLAEAPIEAVRRLPFPTWLRLQRMIEGSQTVCLLLGRETMARSSAGLTVRVDRVATGRGERTAAWSERAVAAGGEQDFGLAGDGGRELRCIETHVVRARPSNATARLEVRTALPVRMAVHV